MQWLSAVLGNHTAAVAAFREVCRLYPGEDDSRKVLGDALRKVGDNIGAEMEYRAAIELDDAHYRYHLSLGQVLMDQGRFGEARHAFDRAVETRHNGEDDEEVAKPYLALAEACQAMRDFNGADQAYRDAIIEEPKWFLPHLKMGEFMQQRGNFQSAASEYKLASNLAEDRDKTFSRKPDFKRIHLGLATCLVRLDAPLGAEEAYRRVIASDPSVAAAHFGLGESLRKRGEDAAAQRAYQQALNLQPTFTAAHLGMAASLRHERGEIALG